MSLLNKGFEEISRNAHQWFEDNQPLVLVTIKRGIFYYQKVDESHLETPFYGVSGGRVYKTPFYSLFDVEKMG